VLEEDLVNALIDSSGLHDERQRRQLRVWVRIFRDGRNLIDSARLVSEALSGSIASG